MTRQLRNDNTGSVVNVHAWIGLVNGWEYYLLEKPNANNIALALVYGDEIEMGDVWLTEIKPYMTCITRDMTDLAAPPNWSWVE